MKKPYISIGGPSIRQMKAIYLHANGVSHELSIHEAKDLAQNLLWAIAGIAADAMVEVDRLNEQLDGRIK